MEPLTAEIPETVEFECPRCGVAVTDNYYGPCPDCRTYLRGAIRGHSRDVAAESYEPKMNVTPNAVASKD